MQLSILQTIIMLCQVSEQRVVMYTKLQVNSNIETEAVGETFNTYEKQRLCRTFYYNCLKEPKNQTVEGIQACDLSNKK